MQSSDVERILTELNHLEKEYGRVPSDQDPNYDVPGEARARIELLLDELSQRGISVSWDGQKYRITQP